MKRRLIILIAVISVGMGIFATSSMAKDVAMITKDDLKAVLGNPDLIIIDVRYDKHWMSSDIKIKGAVREDYNDVKSWAHKYPKNKLIVVYCAWPNEKTSARVAQELIDMGFTNVNVLKGGWNEWSKEEYPTENK